MNQFGLKFFGFSEEEILGKSIFDTIISSIDNHGIDMMEHLSSLYNNTEKLIPHEDEGVCKNGRRVWISWTNNLLLNQAGEIIGLICAGNDITWIREREAKLEADYQVKVAELASLIDAMPMPMFFLDKNGTILNSNKLFLEFYGRSENSLIGKSVYDIFPEKEAEKLHLQDMEVINNPGVRIYDTQRTDWEGNIHDIMIHKATFSDINGKVKGMIGAYVDITERKTAERKIKENQLRF
jgi:PAS domain S-box-containing protein